MIIFTIISNSSKTTWHLKRQKRDLKFHIFQLHTFIPPKRLPDQHVIVISIFCKWTVRICPIYSTREISDPQNYSSFVSISSDALLIPQFRWSQLRFWGWGKQKLFHFHIKERTGFIQNCILLSPGDFSLLLLSPLAFDTSYWVHPCHSLTLLYVKQDNFKPGRMSVSRAKSHSFRTLN